jgi:hypothetical protein
MASECPVYKVALRWGSYGPAGIAVEDAMDFVLKVALGRGCESTEGGDVE